MNTALRREDNSQKGGARRAGESAHFFWTTHGVQARAPLLQTEREMGTPSDAQARRGRTKASPAAVKNGTRILHVKTQQILTGAFCMHFNGSKSTHQNFNSFRERSWTAEHFSKPGAETSAGPQREHHFRWTQKHANGRRGELKS